jgi:hypothetical protein
MKKYLSMPKIKPEAVAIMLAAKTMSKAFRKQSSLVFEVSLSFVLIHSNLLHIN